MSTELVAIQVFTSPMDVARGRRAGLKLLFIAKDADIMASGNGWLESRMEVITMALEISALANKVRTSADAGPAPARLAVRWARRQCPCWPEPPFGK